MKAIVLEENLAEAIDKLQFNLYDEDDVIDLMDLYRATYTSLPVIMSYLSLSYLISTYILYNKIETTEQIITDKFLCLVFGDKINRISRYTYLTLIKETFEVIRIDKSSTLENRNVILHFFYFLSQNLVIKKYDLYSVLRFLYATNNEDTILKQHPKISKLYWNMAFCNEVAVKTALINNDPRSRNNRVYRLSLQVKNINITNAIKDNIITRTLLHKEILTKFIGLITLVNDIYRLTTNIL